MHTCWLFIFLTFLSIVQIQIEPLERQETGMNFCMVSEYNCTFDDFKALVEESNAKAPGLVSEYDLVKVNDHKSILLMNVTDMEGFHSLMTSPEMKQWDEENGCADILYSMERIN